MPALYCNIQECSKLQLQFENSNSNCNMYASFKKIGNRSRYWFEETIYFFWFLLSEWNIQIGRNLHWTSTKSRANKREFLEAELSKLRINISMTEGSLKSNDIKCYPGHFNIQKNSFMISSAFTLTDTGNIGGYAKICLLRQAINHKAGFDDPVRMTFGECDCNTFAAVYLYIQNFHNWSFAKICHVGLFRTFHVIFPSLCIMIMKIRHLSLVGKKACSWIKKYQFLDFGYATSKMYHISLNLCRLNKKRFHVDRNKIREEPLSKRRIPGSGISYDHANTAFKKWAY